MVKFDEFVSQELVFPWEISIFLCLAPFRIMAENIALMYNRTFAS